MCTVTYLPGRRKGEFIFTTNRDEAPGRSASGITRERIAGKTLLFPRDPLANGSWVAVSDTNQLACILNGAFVKHNRKPSYRRSRGLVLLDFFTFPSSGHFFQSYDLSGVEAFTMVVVDNGELYELRWDETRKHVRKMEENKAHLWASCTLYTKEQQQNRNRWFERWQLENEQADQEAVLNFHRHTGEGDPASDLVMNRNGIVRTTSITSIQHKDQIIEMRFEDVHHGEVSAASVRLRAKPEWFIG